MSSYPLRAGRLPVGLSNTICHTVRTALIHRRITERLHIPVYVLGGVVALLPLLWVRVPPLVDYPNHLARMWILVHGAEIPELAANYSVKWRILPDLAMDTFAIFSGSLTLVREMRLPLAVMIALVLLVPHRLSGAAFADIRLPVALPFVIIASTKLEAARKEAVLPFAAAALLVLGLRVWTVSQTWRDYDRWFSGFRAASAVIAPGARLLVVETPLPDRKQLPDVPRALARAESISFIHMAALAVIDRAAFFPYMFTGWTTIDVTPRNEPVSQRQGVPVTPEELTRSANPEQANTLNASPNFLGERPYWRNWSETFDFVVWIDFSGAPKPGLQQLRWLTGGSFFDIYRVVRP